MKKSGWASEFKTFIMRGNVLDMAVGVVIGSAFTAIVTSVVENLLTPIIALIIFCNRGVSDRYVSGQCPGSIVWNRRFHH